MDADDGENFNGTKIRRFRQSMGILKEAKEWFIEGGTCFNMLLGDMLDGQAQQRGVRDAGVTEILGVTGGTVPSSGSESSSEAEGGSTPWYYTLGNHEYYNFSREGLNLLEVRLCMPSCSPLAW